MATRKIVHIDEEKCSGCGECATRLRRGCDRDRRRQGPPDQRELLRRPGSLPGGVSRRTPSPIEEREADEFDEAAVSRHLSGEKAVSCPGSAPQTIVPASWSTRRVSPARLRRCRRVYPTGPCS